MTPGDIPLIRTKLAPPRVGNAPVSRDELLQQLDARRGRKLTLLVGPAGCGKTMLLAQWRQKLFLQGAKVGWYNAGVDDDDVDFAAYVVEALQQAGLELDKESLHIYARSGGKALRELVTSLINDIADQDGDVYLIIDDLHNISSAGTLKLLDRWLALAPQRFHLVLSSRTRPALQLARLRAEDGLTELRFPDLRFSADETRRFLQAQGLPGLSAKHELALQEITDGWAAGLQLLAFSLRKQESPERLFERQARLSLASAEALEEYLETAVLEHLSAEEFSFLVSISACRRFNRELCELLTGDAQAAAHLARFESENLFLIPIDTSDAEPWYRFHRLFAEFLNHRLERMDAAELRKIHQLASHWFSGKNLHVEAMRHATLAGDVAFVVQLIDRAARHMINGANFVELIKWCESVPRESLRGRLNVLLCLAWAQISCGRIEEFERSMRDIAAHADHARAGVQREVQMLRAYAHLCRDETAACLAIVEPMMREAPPSNAFHALLLNNIASMSLVESNDFEGAREVARQRHQLATAQRPDYPRPLIDITDGLSHLIQGNIGQATASLNAYVEDALQRTAFGVDAAGMFLGFLLEAHYQSGSLQSVRALLARYMDLIDTVGGAHGVLFAYRVQARIQQVDGQPDAARETLRRLEEFGYQRRLDRTIAWSLQEQVALALRFGGASIDDLLLQLERLARRYRDARDCAWSEIVLAARLAQAMVAFEQEAGAASLPAIDAAGECALANRRRLLSTRLGLMRAAVLLRAGRPGEGLTLGRGMAEVAAESGMLRVLPDIGRAVLPLLEGLLAGEKETRVHALLEAARAELGGGASSPSDTSSVAAKPRGQFDLLSAREQEILGLLAKALSSKSIARMINVSPGTVKWHMRNIYEKLGVSSREAALAKARKEGFSL